MENETVEAIVRQRLAEFEGSDSAMITQNREKFVQQLLKWIDPEKVVKNEQIYEQNRENRK